MRGLPTLVKAQQMFVPLYLLTLEAASGLG